MEQHTNVDYFMKYNNIKDIPIFAQLIFSSDSYSDEEKFKFKNLFLEEYLKNDDYRKQVQGYYLLFYDNELYAIYEKKEHRDQKLLGYKTMFYKITDTPKIYGYIY